MAEIIRRRIINKGVRRELHPDLVDLSFRLELEPGEVGAAIPRSIRQAGHWFPRTREDGEAVAVLCFATRKEMEQCSEYIARKRADRDVAAMKERINAERNSGHVSG